MEHLTRRGVGTSGWVALLVAVSVAGCDAQTMPQGSYFSSNIQPILQMGCVQQTTGCHLSAARARRPETSICRATTR